MTDQSITVVSGLPRSGTSLMMQMLQNGGMQVLTDGIRAADDDNPRGYFELEAVKRTKQDASWLRKAPGHAVKVIYKLLYDLPATYQYKVIFLRRPIHEILASQGAMLKRLGNAGASVSQDRLATLFNDQLTAVIHYLSEQSQFNLLEIEYHQLLDDPAAAAELVSQFLRQPLDLQRMAAAVDPSLYRQQGQS